jgi:ribonuclease Y
MEYIFYVVLAIGCFFIGYWIRKQKALGEATSAEAKTEKIINEAKSKQKEIILEAQDKALKIINESKKEEQTQRQETKNLQSRLEKRENSFSQKLLELQDKQQKLFDKVSRVEEVKEKIKKIKEDQLQKLEKIAEMNKEEAKEILVKNVESQIKEDLLMRINKLEKSGSDELEQKARDIMAGAMQRLASTYTSEMTTTMVELPSDEMKGRVIGRKGKSRSTIEEMTGCFISVYGKTVAIIGSISQVSIARRAVESLLMGSMHASVYKWLEKQKRMSME